MEYVANLTRANIEPGAWARTCELEGWDGVAIADHSLLDGRLWPHVWVAASAMAAATERVFVTTAFANNLFRHPVEFAQAAMAMQLTSGGRFEAGLGAGWSAEELEAVGWEHPAPGERVERYNEALIICRQLFDTGRCSFDGEWYSVEVAAFAIDGVAPPPLVGALGGPRMLRTASAHLDRIEIKAASSATRGGALDFAALGRITVDDVRRKIDIAREANPDAALGFFALCGASPESAAMGAGFADDSIYKPFFGEAAQVVDAIESLAELGIDRATVSAVDPSHFGPIIAARAAAGGQ